MNPIRVLLVDDHRVVVQGVHAILEKEAGFDVVGEATSGEEALELLDRHRPDVVLTDINLRGSSGIQFTRETKARHPNVRILALTIHSDEEYIAGMIQAGADGYILKSVSAAELAQAIRLVAQGQVLYPAAAKKLLAQELGVPLKVRQTDVLTEREREILRLIAMGATSREIASKLFLSSKTVDNHRARILEKLQVRNKAEAVAHAIRGGFITTEAPDPHAPLVQFVPPANLESKKGSAQHRPPVQFSALPRYNNRYHNKGEPGDGSGSGKGTAGSEAIL